MFSKIYSCSVQGLKCNIIEVQADISNGLPSFNIVGLGDTSVQEAKERVRSSIKNTGLTFPQTRKTINLAPAQIRKQGSSFDLPIAISLLMASQQIPYNFFNDSILVGELSLTGQIMPVTGILALTDYVKSQGFKKIYLPKANAAEASFIKGIEIYPVENLRQIVNCANSNISLPKYKHLPQTSNRKSRGLKFNNIIGLQGAKRGLQIAAAGGHNTLLFGAPGCSKTVLCRALKSLLPPPTNSQALEITKIYSIMGRLNPQKPLIDALPFREVHHTATIPSIIGGGPSPKPGEITLAHHGILFLDEIAEFPQKTLETLRQPLEDKSIHLSRNNQTQVYPANFTLLATMNPCPCGYYKQPPHICKCTESRIKNYQKKISGPLLDRFDIFLHVKKSSMQDLFKNSKPTKFHIDSAIKIQNQRKIKNADLSLKQIKKYCQLDPETQQILNQAAKTSNLSNRSYLKILKVARTIADLENSPQIQQPHLLEALQYKTTQL